MNDQTRSVPLHNVEIHSARGKDVIHVQVPAHEIDVLKVIHGEANVQDAGEGDEVGTLPANAAGEFLRLQTKYRQPGQQDPVRFAFPNGAASLVPLGFDKSGDAAKPVQSSQRKHAPAKAAAKPDADKPAKAAGKPDATA